MNLKSKIQNPKFHAWLLLVWVAIGTGLRLTQLTSKSPWTDEFSTMVFSLGNSFRAVPLNQIISLDTLLQPLQPNPSAGIKEVIDHLLGESNHPPLYFVLAHLWMKLFPLTGNGVSLWAARSFPALLGAASIPAVYGLSWLAFRSRLISQLTAAIMAVSPYGIFLAQEARHYTLAILWVIASLSCLVAAVRYVQRQTTLPIGLLISWVGINSLGIATHYFFTLTLCAEAIVLFAFWIFKFRTTIYPKLPTNRQNLKSLCAVAAGTVVSALVWLPVWQNGYASELTQWIQSDERISLALLNPVFQAIAAWVTMLSLLPVEASALPVVLASGAVMILFFLWVVPIIVQGIKTQLMLTLESRIATQLLGGFVFSAIALFFVFTYCLGIDLTRGARYNFVYFPAVMVLIGASLASIWQVNETRQVVPFKPSLLFPTFKYLQGKKAVVLIWIMGLMSGLTVVCNLGYQKYYRPDLLVSLIQDVSQVPALIATTHETHVQTGEMMGIAWELKRQHSPINPQFFLAHHEPNTTTSSADLQQSINELGQPLDLWLVNFHAPVELSNCSAEPQSLPPVDGYKYQLYHCSVKN